MNEFLRFQLSCFGDFSAYNANSEMAATVLNNFSQWKGLPSVLSINQLDLVAGRTTLQNRPKVIFENIPYEINLLAERVDVNYLFERDQDHTQSINDMFSTSASFLQQYMDCMNLTGNRLALNLQCLLPEKSIDECSQDIAHFVKPFGEYCNQVLFDAAVNLNARHLLKFNQREESCNFLTLIQVIHHGLNSDLHRLSVSLDFNTLSENPGMRFHADDIQPFVEALKTNMLEYISNIESVIQNARYN